MAKVVAKAPRARKAAKPAKITKPAQAAQPADDARESAVDNRNIGRVLGILQREAPKWNAPVVTLINTHERDPFRTLTSCILSLRTKDEVTAIASRRMFTIAGTPERMAAIDEGTLARAIYPVGFYRTKAKQLIGIAQQILERFGGNVPDEIDALLTLPGVGRKTANLVVGQAFAKPAICVDTHVHRITNRWGYVRTKTPEQTELALRATLPAKHWLIINDLLVAFGQTLCHPTSPKCSSCPVARSCPRIGVVRSR